MNRGGHGSRLGSTAGWERDAGARRYRPGNGRAATMATAEQQRLSEADTRGVGWRRWGPYLSERHGARSARTTAVTATRGHRSPTTRPAPGLPLGRGRAGGDQRRPAAAVPGAGSVERARPDPEGAAVRPDQLPRATTAKTSRNTTSTSTPRRPRSYLKMLYKYPQARIPLRRPGCDQRSARKDRSRIRADRHRDLRREPLFRRRSSSTRRPRPRTSSCRSPCTTAGRTTPSCTCCPRSGSGTPGRGRAARDRPSLQAGRRTGGPAPSGRAQRARQPVAVRRPAGTGPGDRERDQQRAGVRLAPTRRRYVKDGIDRAVVHGEAAAVNPAGTGTKAAAAPRADRSRPGAAPRCDCG